MKNVDSHQKHVGMTLGVSSRQVMLVRLDRRGGIQILRERIEWIPTTVATIVAARITRE